MLSNRWIPGERRCCISVKISHVNCPSNCQLGAITIRLIVISIGAPIWLTHLFSDICALGEFFRPQTCEKAGWLAYYGIGFSFSRYSATIEVQSAFKSIWNTLHGPLIFLAIKPPNSFNISITSMPSSVSNDLLYMMRYCFS